MNNAAKPPLNEIKKLHVEATVLFAINHVPSVDEDTLMKFLELVNITGNFGSIREEHLVQKMEQILKYIPGSCEYSLVTLGELLNIRFPCEVENDNQAKNGKVIGVIAPVHEREVRHAV